MYSKHILVVDDDKEVVRLMRSYLEKAGYRVQVAYNGETALHIIQREQPDLVLLDLMLPDRDGWEITRQIRQNTKRAHIPIIMLTARVTDDDKILGLELGANDYVTKPYNPREVVARVRAHLQAQSRARQDDNDGIQEGMLRAGDLEMDLGRRIVSVKGRQVRLTVTEFDLLRALLEQAGYVMTRSELIRKALGTDYLGVDRTLDSHIRNLRQKIDPHEGGESYIETIYGVGYRLVVI